MYGKEKDIERMEMNILQELNKPSGKDHKFFERFLDIDLGGLASFLQNQYSDMESLRLKGITQINNRDAAPVAFDNRRHGRTDCTTIRSPAAYSLC